MNTIYITMTALIIIVCLINFLNGYNDFIDWVGSIFFGAILGLFIGAMIALFLPSEKETVLTETYELQSFKDNSSLKGGFFLGTGSIDGTMKYTFYYKIEGGFKLMQLDYKDVIVKYSNESPKVEKFREIETKATINKYSFSFKNTSYVVYVPEGTIKQNYILDAE